MKKSINSLPEKWCVKADGNGPIGRFFNAQCNGCCYTNFNDGYLHSINFANQNILQKGNLSQSFYASHIRTNFKEISQALFIELFIDKTVVKKNTYSNKNVLLLI